MSEIKSSYAESTLEQPGIHEEWVSNYRTPDNEHFYNMAFDLIVESFDAPPGATVLDAGCGSCAKSRNLVDRGFHVIGTDLSPSALKMARRGLQGTAYQDRIELQQQNLTAITMPDNSIDYLVCWGVLMHIPRVDKAIAELCRIVKPGGGIAISEGNMHSLKSRSLRLLKKLLGRERAEVYWVPAGIEIWEETAEGRLMTRQANIPWLIAEFEKHGLQLEKHVAGQFSEMYWVVPTAALKKLIHWFNHFWFKVVKSPGLAFGNILIFKKR
jgi:ubiquinone/menaquinone biosynthesis C-methylase UbiE